MKKREPWGDSEKTIILPGYVEKEHAGGGDAGHVVKFICPKCGGTAEVGEYAWWDSVCGCGLEWEFRIVGTRR